MALLFDVMIPLTDSHDELSDHLVLAVRQAVPITRPLTRLQSAHKVKFDSGFIILPMAAFSYVRERQRASIEVTCGYELRRQTHHQLQHIL